MELHGRSLRIDDTSLLVAAHYQGGRIPRETACFTCHTTYAMLGDLRAKLTGLHHMYVNYIKGPPKETRDPPLQALQQPRVPALPRRNSPVRRNPR